MDATEKTKTSWRAWMRFVWVSAVASFAILYLIYAAEFDAVRAVYEAY